MNVITIEHSAFRQIADRLEALEKALCQSAEDRFRQTWFDGAKVMELLGISRDTLCGYRSQGRLGFSQIGKKCYYRASDVFEFMERHYNKAFNTRR